MSSFWIPRITWTWVKWTLMWIPILRLKVAEGPSRKSKTGAKGLWPISTTCLHSRSLSRSRNRRNSSSGIWTCRISKGRHSLQATSRSRAILSDQAWDIYLFTPFRKHHSIQWLSRQIGRVLSTDMQPPILGRRIEITTLPVVLRTWPEGGSISMKPRVKLWYRQKRIPSTNRAPGNYSWILEGFLLERRPRLFCHRWRPKYLIGYHERTCYLPDKTTPNSLLK